MNTRSSSENWKLKAVNDSRLKARKLHASAFVSAFVSATVAASASASALYLVNYTLECGSATLVMATFMVQSQLHTNAVMLLLTMMMTMRRFFQPPPCPFLLRFSHFPLHTVTLLMSKCCNLRHNPRLTSPPCLADNEGLDRKDEADDFSELHAPRFDSCCRLSDSAFVWLCIRPLAIAFCLLIALPSSFCCCCCSLCCRCSSLCCCSFCCRLCLLAECKTFKLKV